MRVGGGGRQREEGRGMRRREKMELLLARESGSREEGRGRARSEPGSTFARGPRGPRGSSARNGSQGAGFPAVASRPVGPPDPRPAPNTPRPPRQGPALRPCSPRAGPNPGAQASRGRSAPVMAHKTAGHLGRAAFSCALRARPSRCLYHLRPRLGPSPQARGTPRAPRGRRGAQTWATF